MWRACTSVLPWFSFLNFSYSAFTALSEISPFQRVLKIDLLGQLQLDDIKALFIFLAVGNLGFGDGFLDQLFVDDLVKYHRVNLVSLGAFDRQVLNRLGDVFGIDLVAVDDGGNAVFGPGGQCKGQQSRQRCKGKG